MYNNETLWDPFLDKSMNVLHDNISSEVSKAIDIVSINEQYFPLHIMIDIIRIELYSK